MYAIIDVSDKQYKVREDEHVYVPHQRHLSPDDTFTFDRVLLVSDGAGTVHLGAPTVAGATVEARVLGHVRGDKVMVFKKKRRKRYKVRKGHRQRYTQLRITSLSMNGDQTEKEEATELRPASETQPEAEAPAEAQAESNESGEPVVQA